MKSTKLMPIGIELPIEEPCMAVLVWVQDKRMHLPVIVICRHLALQKKLQQRPRTCHLELVAMQGNFWKAWAGKRGTHSENQQRDWWNLLKQMETLVMLD